MSTTTALAGTFASDPVHSSFGFAVKYQNVSIFRGTLSEVNATLVDGNPIANLKLLFGTGEPAPIGPDHAVTPASSYFWRRAMTIYGGSTEIQKNIMAKHVLGL